MEVERGAVAGGEVALFFNAEIFCELTNVFNILFFETVSNTLPLRLLLNRTFYLAIVYYLDGRQDSRQWGRGGCWRRGDWQGA